MGTKTLPLTVADYMLLDEPPLQRYELLEGELLVTPSGRLWHNRIRQTIEFELRLYLQRHPDRADVISETDFLIGPDTVLRPDAAVIVLARYRPEFEEQLPLPLAPDIAIEVLSPSDRPGAVRRKIRAYLAGGVNAAWIVDSERNELRRHSAAAPEGERRDTLAELDLLPGFSMTWQDLRRGTPPRSS